MERYEFAKKLICECADIIRQHLQISVEYKSGYNDLVTDVDTLVETTIRNAITKQYPQDTILGEELGGCLSDSIWIIDPIDGTANFVTRRKDYAISIAYYKNKQPVFGLVYDVYNDELYTGDANGHSYCNNKPLKVKTCNLQDCVVDISAHALYTFEQQNRVRLLDIVKDVRQVRSYNCASLAICSIAKGDCQCFLSASVKVWDYAAAAIILTNAGGSIVLNQDFFCADKTQIIAYSDDLIKDYALNKSKIKVQN